MLLGMKVNNVNENVFGSGEAERVTSGESDRVASLLAVE